ncbi:MAG: hypothetical protein P8Y76_04400, partial [bacterium]
GEEADSRTAISLVSGQRSPDAAMRLLLAALQHQETLGRLTDDSADRRQLCLVFLLHCRKATAMKQEHEIDFR